MTKLEEARYISVEKEFIGKKPNTKLGLTPKGRIAFNNYRTSMNPIFTPQQNPMKNATKDSDGNNSY